MAKAIARIGLSILKIGFGYIKDMFGADFGLSAIWKMFLEMQSMVGNVSANVGLIANESNLFLDNMPRILNEVLDVGGSIEDIGTVVEKLSNSHSKIWADFMRSFLNIFSNHYHNIVYILMGKEAQKVKQYINNGIFIETAHPSPLARGAFFGSKPFSKANIELTKLGKTVIDWTKL